MKAACQTCDAGLAANGAAFICSHECTFCPDCTQGRYQHVCPNCGGELVARPRRTAS